MTTLVLVNAKGGTVRDRGRAAIGAEIASAFEEHGAEADIGFIHPRDLGPRIRAALDGKHPSEAIYVGGGDGSLSSAAGLMAGSGVALGALPLGTMNLFARGLGVPLAIGEAAGALIEAEREKIDLLDINGHPVLMHASVGLQPKIIRTREMLPYRTRFMRLTNGVIAWIRATRRLSPVRISGRTGEGSFERTAAAILISNNRLPEGLAETPVSHDMTAGEIAVYICASYRRADLVRLALATSLGTWRDSDLVEEIVTGRLDIASDRRNLLMSLDGELVRLDAPLECRLRRRALTVLMPRQKGAEDEGGKAADAIR